MTFWRTDTKTKFQKRCILCKKHFTTENQNKKYCSDCKAKHSINDEGIEVEI